MSYQSYGLWNLFPVEQSRNSNISFIPGKNQQCVRLIGDLKCSHDIDILVSTEKRWKGEGRKGM